MSDDLCEAIERLTGQVTALQADVRALDRRSSLPPRRRPTTSAPSRRNMAASAGVVALLGVRAAGLL